ncbi:MAG: alpha/beta hydrolase [Cytophagales bacterium]|nr:alpha/beta hydrolase [Cytophagales bacterium]
MKKIAIRSSLIFVAIVAVGYLGIIGWFIANETSIVFHPDYTTRTVGTPPDSLHLNFKPVTLTTSDQVELKGWEVYSPLAEPNAMWVLFFHGNAGNVSDMGYPQRYAGWASLGYNTLAIDYRGYGASQGTPSEMGLYTDALTAYNYLVQTKKIPAQRIVIYGYSLGSGPATELASNVAARALILEGAYTSVPDVGAELYPFLPIELMASNKFANRLKIDKINKPLLIFHAKADAQIPFAHGQRLYDLAKSPKQFIELKGGHIDAQFVDRDKMYTGMKKFLENPMI